MSAKRKKTSKNKKSHSKNPISKQTRAVEKKLEKACQCLEDFSDVVSAFKSLKSRLQRPLQVAVVGEFSAGKSTFLNALFEQDILPTGILPTTGCVLYIRYGQVPSAVVHYKDGSSENLPFRQLSSLASHVHTAESEGSQLHSLSHIDLFLEHDLLKQAVFVDTPGLNAPSAADTEITEKLLEQSDAIIWLTSATQVLSATEIDTLKRFDERYHGKSLCVIAKTDLLNNRKRELGPLMKRAKKSLGNYFVRIVAVSAHLATQGHPEELKDFQVALWEELLPLRQKITHQAVLLDAQKILQDGLQRIHQSRLETESLLQHLNNTLEQLDGYIFVRLQQSLSSIARRASRQFRELENELRQQINDRLQRRVHLEPYTKTIEGWFTDDQVVDYRQETRWEWPEWAVERTYKWFRREIESVFERFESTAIDELHVYMQRVTTANETLFSHDGWEREFRVPLEAEQQMAFSTLQKFMTALESYFWGGLNNGSLWTVSFMIYSSEQSYRPGRSQLEDWIVSFVPLEETIGGIVDHNEEVIESICESIREPYKWPQQHLEQELARHRELEGQLSKAFRKVQL